MIEESEFFSAKTLLEIQMYIKRIRETIKGNIEEIKKMRLKTGLYKKYREELIPLLEYGILEYGLECKYLFQLIKGNQSYDAVVLKDGAVIEIIEITNPQNGEKNFIDAKELNDNGITEIKVFGSESQNEISSIIVNTALKKAKKNYKDKTLVIFIDEAFEFDLSDEDDCYVLDDLSNYLRSIKYSAAKVVFLIMHQNWDKAKYDSKIYSIK